MAFCIHLRAADISPICGFHQERCFPPSNHSYTCSVHHFVRRAPGCRKVAGEFSAAICRFCPHMNKHVACVIFLIATQILVPQVQPDQLCQPVKKIKKIRHLAHSWCPEQGALDSNLCCASVLTKREPKGPYFHQKSVAMVFSQAKQYLLVNFSD